MLASKLWDERDSDSVFCWFELQDKNQRSKDFDWCKEIHHVHINRFYNYFGVRVEVAVGGTQPQSVCIKCWRDSGEVWKPCRVLWEHVWNSSVYLRRCPPACSSPVRCRRAPLLCPPTGWPQLRRALEEWTSGDRWGSRCGTAGSRRRYLRRCGPAVEACCWS